MWRMAKSVDDLLTSHYFTGQRDFSDAKTASALKKIISSVHYQKESQCRRATCSTYDRFLRGRQIVYMIHKHCQSTGTYDTAQCLSDLFGTCLQNDNVQKIRCKMGPK